MSDPLVYLKSGRRSQNCPQQTRLKLTENGLVWQENGNRQSLSRDEILGVEQMPGNPLGFVISACPTIARGSWYPRRSPRTRTLYKKTFICESEAQRSRWVGAIASTLPDNPQRRWWVAVNPVSGRRRGWQIFEQVRPILEAAGVQLTAIATTHPGHVRDLVRNLDLSQYDGLALVGGDGIVHEAIAGLASREDAENALKTPIAPIPAGTGNGLCKALLDAATEAYDPIAAALAIAKGRPRPLDLAAIAHRGRRYYSLLSLSWAIVSEVDIHSERLRFLGSLRTDLYAIWQIFKLPTYRARFSFLPYDRANLLTQNSFKNCQDREQKDWQTIEAEFIVFWAMNVPWSAYNLKPAPLAHLSDGAIDVVAIRRGVSRWQVLQAFLKCATGEHLTLPGVEYYKVAAFALDPFVQNSIISIDGEAIAADSVNIEVLPGKARVMSLETTI
ncbi:diacylglycerol kinase [Oxynema sp. CENA135]|uniref:diacylglycerol kinase family protein n=1 Tax=Oxynema sp. CENA135 TaxID=984206 RepID=UPI00190AD87A|nr:diacylglycerol kinase family protein [Oxynema sp. CENA135]MBK4732650.1 diacylglycerol kinase [Oxynema sp. CENA135]